MSGRPSIPAVLAVDVGGTKLAAGLVDDQGRAWSVARVPTPVGTDPETVFATLVRLADAVRDQAGADHLRVEGCGVGCGGPMDSETVSPLNLEAWRSFPLRARLAEHTGLPTWVDNDAKALALGEGWTGAAAGRDHYMAMVVSTGVGGGIVCDGRLLDGARGNAGHVGHVIVEPGGRLCGCGARGCLEAEASGTAIAALTGRPPAEAGAEVIERTGRLVGRGVASVVNLLDLELVVVAGSVALGFGPSFFASAQAEVDRCCRIEFARGARIAPAGLGARGPVVGAGAVGWRGLGRPVPLGRAGRVPA